MTLVLFDIDGTILTSDGAGRRAIHRALREVFGGIGPEGHWFDGKTDRQIVRELMSLDGHAPDHIDARMDELLERYVRYLEAELAALPEAPRVFAGVLPLLDALEAQPGVTLGLLTGNLEGGARAKLAAAGIAFDRFRANAFGSDHELRPELPAVARTRAEALLGRAVAGHDVVVIGDTPADVTCGRAIGARAVGVATGRYSVAELLEHEPWATFDSLEDTDAVLAAILD